MKWTGDFFNLLFPRICACCGNNLWKSEEIICHSCHFHLPETGFHLADDNPVSSLFYGRFSDLCGTAYLNFSKGGKVQHLVHQLKYKGRKDIGIYLGKVYGRKLAATSRYSQARVIVPVPLHKKKYMKRGYNQSEQFGLGLSAAMQIPLNRHLLARARASETQTRKGRFERHRNVEDIFRVSNPGLYQGLHILLVDDVITTGATLEACITALQEIPGARISFACIAAALV